jgi:hypothetical protein
MGRIEIFDDYALVDLPEGMPKDMAESETETRAPNAKVPQPNAKPIAVIGLAQSVPSANRSLRFIESFICSVYTKSPGKKKASHARLFL